MTKTDKIKQLIKNQKTMIEHLALNGDSYEVILGEQKWNDAQEQLAADIADDAHGEVWDSYKPSTQQEVEAFTGFTKQ